MLYTLEEMDEKYMEGLDDGFDDGFNSGTLFGYEIRQKEVNTYKTIAGIATIIAVVAVTKSKSSKKDHVDPIEYILTKNLERRQRKLEEYRRTHHGSEDQI